MSIVNQVDDLVEQVTQMEAEYKASCAEFDLPENIADFVLEDKRIPARVRGELRSALVSEKESQRAEQFASARSGRKRRRIRQMI